MQELKDDGFRILGLDSEAPDDIAAVDRTPPVAIVLGAEGKGLRQLTRDSCDHLVRLDMNGPIRSLNVSNACAVTLYALTR
jgi:23S rRNA (guanosine2251-2'-O)-methyltransferase